MDDLIAFLKARLDEDERAAVAAAKFGEAGFTGRPQWINQYGMVTDAEDHDWAIVDLNGMAIGGEPVYVQIARHDPARTLREVEAKRAILGRHEPAGKEPVSCLWCSEDEFLYRWPCPDVLSIAAIYSDHPDYRQEWKP